MILIIKNQDKKFQDKVNLNKIQELKIILKDKTLLKDKMSLKFKINNTKVKTILLMT